MDFKEVIKIVILLFLYGVAAPGLGYFLKGRRQWQRIAFAVMCFMLLDGLFSAADWGLTLKSVEWYRGHARGFHFYFNEVLALGLILAQWLERQRDFRWLPPGLWIYLALCGVSFLTVFLAPSPLYVCMAAFKGVKMLVIAAAAYNFLKEEKDLRFFLFVMVFTMCWEMGVVLLHKYVERIYQIRGTFDHQNSLTMFTGLIGMSFLAVGLGPAFRGINFCLVGFVACSVIVQSALSRGGLGAFAIGTMVVVGLSLAERITARRIAVLGVLGLISLAGLAIGLDTIIERFTETRNKIGNKTRTLLKESAWEMFKDHPLGVGWNNFALVMNPPYRYGDNFDRWTIERGYSLDRSVPKGVVESLYWLLLAETGPQSVAVFFVLAGMFLWWNLRAAYYFRGTFLGCASLGIFAGCGINYLQSYFERVLVFDRNTMLWIIMLAITSKIEVWRRRSVRERRGAAAGVRTLPMGAGVVNEP